MGNITLKKYLIFVFILTAYNTLRHLFEFDYENYFLGYYFLLFIILSSSALYLYRENKITKYYLIFAFVLNLVQITNELSSIKGGTALETLGARSFTFYMFELLLYGVLYVSGLFFINKVKTVNKTVNSSMF